MGTRQKNLVTFWCERGCHEVTEEHGPGQTPRYCAEYSGEAQRALNALRVKAYRRRQKGQNTA